MMSVWADIYLIWFSQANNSSCAHRRAAHMLVKKKNLILWGAANQKKGSLKGGGRELEMASSLSYTPRIKRNMSLFPFKVDHLPLLAAHHSRWYASISPYPYILLCHSSLPYILFLLSPSIVSVVLVFSFSLTAPYSACIVSFKTDVGHKSGSS